MATPPEMDELMESIHQYLVTQTSANELWTQDDTVILDHLLAAVEAAHRQGYSEALLQDVMTGLFSL